MRLCKCATNSVKSLVISCCTFIFIQFKERDELDRIFKLWIQRQSSASSSGCSAPILMSKAWDYRVRQHLGTRYNSKGGCFDWDLTMKLHEKGVFEYLFFRLKYASKICPQKKDFKAEGQKFGGFYVALKDDNSFCTDSAVWCHQQTTICAMEGTGFGVRNEGRCLPNNQSKFALFASVQSGKCLFFYTMQR